MSIQVIVLSISLFSVSAAYLVMTNNFNKLRDQYQKLFVDMMLLEKLINEIEESKIKSDESVHKENFIKFLSDSRDWAYEYIEDVQAGLKKFVEDIKPEINYFKEHGDIVSMHPNYYSMKKIAASYDELLKLLPETKDEE